MRESYADSRPLAHQYPYLGAHVRSDLAQRSTARLSWGNRPDNPPRRLKALNNDTILSGGAILVRAGDDPKMWRPWFEAGGPRLMPNFVQNPLAASLEQAMAGLLDRVRTFFEGWKGYGVSLELSEGLYAFSAREAFRELRYFAYGVSPLEAYQVDAGFPMRRLEFSPALREVIDSATI